MRGAVLVAVSLGLLLGALPASAQAPQAEACRAPVLSVQQAPGVFEPGEAFTLLFAIENPNGPPVEAVRATVTTTAPAGWTAVAAQRDLTLGPRNVTVDVLAITAPTRGTGEPGGNITLHVTFVCTSGDIQTSASARTTVEVQIQGFQAPWPILLGAFALLATGVAFLGFRRLRRSVALLVPQAERPILPGKTTKFVFAVENRRGKPQHLTLVATGVPEGWSLHLALQELDLEPGEEKALWAILKAPPTAEPGTDVPITLRLDGRAAREGASAVLRARVEAPT